MTLASDEIAELKDPYGGDGELPPPEEVMGVQLPPVDMPDARFVNQTFAFDGEVARRFEELVIPRQIPGYAEMRHRLLHVAMKTALPNSKMIDLGTSNGRMIRDLALAIAGKEGYDIRNIEFVGVDLVDDMLNQSRILFKELKDEIAPARFNYNLLTHDLREGMLPVPDESVGLVTSIYTIQFVPPEHRLRIIDGIYKSLKPGGAFIWAEKILSTSNRIDQMMTDIYYEEKSRNGIDDETIVTKRKSLEGSLMPFTHKGNVELLESAGFQTRNIDVFWRNLQFEALVAIK